MNWTEFWGGSDRGLIGVLPRHLLGAAVENHEKLVGIVGIATKIRREPAE
jgi:hypothetical protein